MTTELWGEAQVEQPVHQDQDPSRSVGAHDAAPRTRPASPPGGLIEPGAAAPAGFIGSLSHVASVVSSRSSIQEVLQHVVDEAKVLVRCRKAMLLLFDEASDEHVTRGAIVVRGSRGQYPEAWWRACIEAVGPECVESGGPRFVQDRERDATLVCVPIRARDRSIGLLSAINSHARSFTDEQVMLLVVLGAFAGAAIENARLRAQSEYSLLAGERNRIAKEMHDGLAQSLFSASLALEVCKRRVRVDPDEVEEKLTETQQVLADSLTELRRYIYDLHPMSLERLGLAGAIQQKLDEILGAGRLSGALSVSGEERPLPPSVEICLYRVSQEAMANAVRHAKAGSLTVALRYREDGVDLLVEDDGQGFDADDAYERGETGKSLGLRSMRDRVRAEGGKIRVSSAPSVGTSVWVMVPC